MKAQRGSRGIALLFPLTLALDGVGGQRHAPAALPPGKRPGTHCIGGWMGLRAGLDGCGKSRPPTPGFNPRTVQPVASRCNDCAALAHKNNKSNNNNNNSNNNGNTEPG